MPDQPNILLITTDQQRYDTTGPAAPSFMRTPHMDHLAREGVSFSRAYAQCPLCVPSRVSIMSGRSPMSLDMCVNGHSSRVLGRDDTLPGLLRGLGYQTAAIGKMHFGPQRVRHGFDEMILPEDYYTAMARSGNPLQPMRHGLGQNEQYPTLATVPEAMTLTSWIAEQCVDYILERRDPSAPFFLWCSFSKPHPPYDPPEPYYSMYRDCPIPKPIGAPWSEPGKAPAWFERFRQRFSFDLVPDEVWHEARAAYYGLITQCDYNMGRLFAALQDLNLFRDTLILFTSDHGEFIGDYATAAKSFFYDPAARVPMVLRLPHAWENRCNMTTASTPVTHADILPTLVSAAGGTPPENCDGVDLVGVARETPDAPRYIDARADDGWPTRNGAPKYLAITDGRWKFIHYPEGASKQLFDLANDTREQHNLAHEREHLEKVRELREALIERERARGGAMLEDGGLPVRPLVDETERDRRNQSGPGYHTERIARDIRH